MRWPGCWKRLQYPTHPLWRMGLLDLCLRTVLFILQQIDVRTLHPVMSQLNAPLSLQLSWPDQIVPRPIQSSLDWSTSHPTWVKIQPCSGSYDLLWHFFKEDTRLYIIPPCWRPLYLYFSPQNVSFVRRWKRMLAVSAYSTHSVLSWEMP